MSEDADFFCSILLWKQSSYKYSYCVCELCAFRIVSFSKDAFHGKQGEIMWEQWRFCKQFSQVVPFFLPRLGVRNQIRAPEIEGGKRENTEWSCTQTPEPFMFWKPTGELMNNSCESYIELISGGFLHVSCLSVLFVWLLCLSAVVTPSGNGRIVSLPSGSSSAATSEQPDRKGIAVPCPSFPQSWFGSRLKFTHVKLKLELYMMANWYKIQVPCNK